MIFDLLPIIIILLSLAVIVFIVIKKFPQVANVDLEQIPEEKQAGLKKEILEKQFEKRFKKATAKISHFIEPATLFLANKFSKLKEIIERKRKNLETQNNTLEEQEKSQAEILHDLLDQGASLMEEENYLEAEKKFIKALTIDKHVSLIYKNLGEIYFEQKKYDYAVETFKYLISLENKKAKEADLRGDSEAERLIKRDIAQIYFELAQTYKLLENIKEAKSAVDKALLIDFKNPRYLDFLCEVCIILGDKLGAQGCVSRLREVNAENKKLELLVERIEQL
jgi:tetratricopeptide (TPR) repeat protein